MSSTARRMSIIVDLQGANRVAQQLNKVNTIGDRVNTGFKKMTAGIMAFGKSALITTAAITGLAYAATRLSRAILTPFMDLETTMARVRIAEGATIEQTKMLTDVVSQLGRDSPFTAAEAAQGMFYLAKAGLNVQQTMAAIPGVLQAAVVEQLDLGTAADIVTGLLNEFSLAANQAGFAADVLAKGSNLAKTNMPEMSEALKYFGTTAYELGYDIQHSVAMLDVLAGKMIRGTMAGTAMRQSMLLFQKVQASGVFATKAQIDAINRLGLDAGWLAKQISAGDLTFIKFIGTLKKAGATTGDFASIFEQRAATAVNALAEAAEDAFPRYVDELNNALGFTKEATDVLADTLGEQMRQVSSSMEAFTNVLAETVAPALKDFLEDKLRPFINGMTAAWQNGGDTIKDKIQSVADYIAPAFRSGMEAAIDTIKELAPSLGREIGRASTKIAAEILKGAVGALTQVRYGVPIGGWDFQSVAPPAGTFNAGNVRIEDITQLLDYLKKPTIAEMAPYSPLPEKGWQELIDILKTMPDSYTAKALALSYPELAARLSPRALDPFGLVSSSIAGLGSTIDQTISNLDVLTKLREAGGVSAITTSGESSAVADTSFIDTLWSSFVDAVNGNTDAVNGNTDAISGQGSGGLAQGIGKAVGSFVNKGIDSVVGGVEGVLISAVTEPITAALTDYLGPTMDKIGTLAGKVLHIFDPLVFLFNQGLDVLTNLLGGPDYNQGRYTGAGAYQVASYATGGIAATPQLAMVGEAGPEIIMPMSSLGSLGGGVAVNSAGVSINGDINVSVDDGQDVGAAVVEEIARHEEITTRQIARSLQQGMVKREAMER